MLFKIFDQILKTLEKIRWFLKISLKKHFIFVNLNYSSSIFPITGITKKFIFRYKVTLPKLKINSYAHFRYVFELPELSCDKSRIFYGGLKDLDPEKLVVPEVLSLFFSLVDLKSNLIPYANGWRIVIDSKGFAFGHFVKLTSNMGVIRKAICYVQVWSNNFLKLSHKYLN